MRQNVYIFGASGHAKEMYCLLLDLGRATEFVAFVESDGYYHARTVLGHDVVPLSSVSKYADAKLILAVGDSVARSSLAMGLLRDFEFESLVHPDARISRFVEYGDGCIVTQGCILTCDITLGHHVHLNLNTTIGHECSIGSFVSTAHGVNISGNVTIGDRVSLGANASIRNGVTVCPDVVVGMGAAVVSDIHEPGIYVGTPAKRLIRSLHNIIEP